MKSLKKLWIGLNCTLPHQKVLRLALGLTLAIVFVLWMEHYWQAWLGITFLLYMLVKLLESLQECSEKADELSGESGPEATQVATLFAIGAPAIAFRLLSGKKLFSNTHS